MKALAEFKNDIQLELVARVVGTVAGALTIVFLARFLGAEAYGLLFLALSVFYISGMVGELGIRKSAGKYITEYKQKDPSQVRYIIRVSLGVNLALLILVAAALSLGRNYISSFIDEPGLEPLLVAGGAFVIIRGLFRYLRKAFQGFQRTKVGSGLKVCNAVIRFGLVVVIVLLGYEAVGALVGYILAFGVSVLAGFVILRSHLVSEYEKTADPEPGLARRILEYSIPLVLTQGSDKLMKQTDVFLIGVFLNPVAVGYYGVSKQLLKFTMVPANALGYSIGPAFADKKAGDEAEQATQLYEETLIYTFLLYVPATLGIVLIAEPLIVAVFGAEYLGAVPALQVLSVYTLLRAVTRVSSTALDYLGRASDRAKVKGGSAIGNVILNVVMIPPLGIAGAAGATVITYAAYAVANMVLMWYELEFRTAYLLRKTIQILLISGLMGVGVFVALSYTAGIPSVVISVAVGLVVWAILSTATGLIDISELRPVGG